MSLPFSLTFLNSVMVIRKKTTEHYKPNSPIKVAPLEAPEPTWSNLAGIMLTEWNSQNFSSLNEPGQRVGRFY